MLSFLNPNEQVHLPTGGDFTPTGLIGNFLATVLYSFYSDVDLVAEYRAMDEKFPGTRRKMGANGFRYYVKDQAAGKVALERAGSKIDNPNQVWTFQADNASLLNVPEKDREKFNNPVAYDVDILTLRSKKRHAFQLMALPSAVAAMAKALGYDSPSFSMAELIAPDAIFTDEFQAQMVGAADGDYRESTLWTRRAALWASLGEADASKYTVGAGGKFDTEADKLKQCLSIVTSTWNAPAWLRLLNVPDPRVDAVYGESRDKRLSVACITRIYTSQAEAASDAKAELDERQARTDAKAGNANGTAPSGPALPTAWIGMQDEFVKELAGYRGKPATVAAKALEVTADEVKAWREVIG